MSNKVPDRDHPPMPFVADRPQGLMANLLGEKLNLQADSEYYSQEEYENLGFARAYDVPILRGKTFFIKSLEEISLELLEILSGTCPRYRWEINKEGFYWYLAFKKYRLIHCCINAPKDTLTSQPMCLEIYGKAIRIGETELGFHHQPSLFQILGIQEDIGTNVLEDSKRFEEALWSSGYEIEILIKVATYSNVTFPGANIPFYM